MKLLEFKKKVKKAWLLAKRFWWVIVMGLLFVVAALLGALTRNGAFLSGVLDLLEAKKEAHEAEMNVLEEIHTTEVKEKNKRLAEHNKRLAEVEEEFASRGEKLNRSKKAELKRLVDESYNDPEKLSKELAEAFGLKHG
jgi:LPS O-antigen subunit length determinant protein (WzzB/FepE family)